MDIVQLRVILGQQIVRLKDSNTNSGLMKLCAELGLPFPTDPETKAERLEAGFAQVPDADIPELARRFVLRCQPDACVRNVIQDILWCGEGYPDIPKRVRRELAKALSQVELFIDPSKFDELLEQLWDLGNDSFSVIFGRPPTGLRAEIQQHMHRNPGDWSAEVFFDKLGAYAVSNRRFALFLEGLVSADVRPDEPSQRRFAMTVNECLRACGVELRETDSEGGYPTFSIVSLHRGLRGRPKNLIFASSVKPDLRLSNAIDNDIEIVTNADKVLVYDRPIGADGLTWGELQLWWAETNQIDDSNEAKASLYKRLLVSLPANSPPQALLFKTFFKTFGKSIPQLPALLPEVWLHWDPQTVKQRGTEALFRFRMDFLLLMPHGVRIVIEVDGKQHYADTNGRADAALYARAMAADRDLKLAGYEVFRFGAAELLASDAEAKVGTFFQSLFKRYSG